LPINRIVLYAQDVEETVRFYEKHFSFEASRQAGDRIIELVSQDGGANLMIHQAAKGQRSGQSTVKLVFDVEDIEAFFARKTDWNSEPSIRQMDTCSPMLRTLAKTQSQFQAEPSGKPPKTSHTVCRIFATS
jgi:hypothetical protein